MSHNNSYGNYAGSYLNECLPNITGQFSIRPASQPGHINRPKGVFSIANNASESGGIDIGSYFNGGIGWIDYSFDANAGSVKTDIYRNSCFSVRPKSYVVYMWVRIS